MITLANPFRIIAHRGASGYAPENTMAAFDRAVSMGVTEVETDVGLTKDGALILFHDNTLERTTNGFGLPEEHTPRRAEATRCRLLARCRDSRGIATMRARA